MNPLQRASRNRKIIYWAVIGALFTVSMVWRGAIPVPLGTSTASAAQPFRWMQKHSIQEQAKSEESGGLGLSDVDPTEGEAEVSGSALRLALTGSRGIMVTMLWQAAIEKQKRNDFHEFEALVGAVTKLQPNFITPWIFQSWNIAYNVSVEMQGSGDMYFYIVRGIQLLAEGERRNKRSPDMRYQIAFYYQNKFGVSDQVETLRCLFDLSCMPPSERNPDRFLKPTREDPKIKELDREAFRQFCEKYPHFVRRLRGEEAPTQDKRAKEKLRAPNPDDVIRFLRDNYQDLPCRYRKNALDQWSDDLADADKQFPALPPQFNEGPNEAHPAIATPDDYAPVVGYFSGYKAARAWFAYSLLLLPPPIKDEQGEPLPGTTPPPGEGGHDPAKHRVPRLPMMIIFRQGMPRAQTYQAELEQKEGWFDGEGWRIEGWFPDRPQGVVVGTGRAWSLIEWQKAAELWEQHGKDYALTLSDRRLANLRQIANDPSLPAEPTPEQMNDPAMRQRYAAKQRAREALQFYSANRHTTNFPYFLASAEAEARVAPDGRPTTVLARKTLWQADQARKRGDPDKAIQLYKDGLLQWKQVLIDNPNFHRLPPPDYSEHGEEETYEYELAYFRVLVQNDDRVREKANEVAHALHGVVPFLTDPFPKGGGVDPLWSDLNKENIKWFVVETVGSPQALYPLARSLPYGAFLEGALRFTDFSSPFVGTLTARHEPWVREEVKETVRSKQGVPRGGAKPIAAPAPAGPGGPSGPGGPGGPPSGRPGG